LNADGERLEKNVESCAETSDPESNEEKDKEPDDAPQQVTAAVSSSAVAFACHFLFLHNKHLFYSFLNKKQTCGDTKRVLCSTVYQLPRFFFVLSFTRLLPNKCGCGFPVEGEKIRLKRITLA